MSLATLDLNLPRSGLVQRAEVREQPAREVSAGDQHGEWRSGLSTALCEWDRLGAPRFCIRRTDLHSVQPPCCRRRPALTHDQRPPSQTPQEADRGRHPSGSHQCGLSAGEEHSPRSPEHLAPVVGTETAGSRKGRNLLSNGGLPLGSTRGIP